MTQLSQEKVPNYRLFFRKRRRECYCKQNSLLVGQSNPAYLGTRRARFRDRVCLVSAFTVATRGKADMPFLHCICPLMTQSGHQPLLSARFSAYGALTLEAAMRRREFIGLLAGAGVVSARSARAATRPGAPGGRYNRISRRLIPHRLARLLRSARRLPSWVRGRDFVFEVRAGSGDADTVRASAKAYVDLRPDVIVGQSTVVTTALARETQTIPIVFVNIADPVASGFAANLARPVEFTGFTVNNTARAANGSSC